MPVHNRHCYVDTLLICMTLAMLQVFDDFRPDLPFYGQPFVHAPNLASFAERSLVFDRAYCQVGLVSTSLRVCVCAWGEDVLICSILPCAY